MLIGCASPKINDQKETGSEHLPQFFTVLLLLVYVAPFGTVLLGRTSHLFERAQEPALRTCGWDRISKMLQWDDAQSPLKQSDHVSLGASNNFKKPEMRTW